jgi:hypothetical protein
MSFYSNNLGKNTLQSGFKATLVNKENHSPKSLAGTIGGIEAIRGGKS